MKTKKIVFFPAFKRVVPSDFENWLEDMALNGWHIERVRQWSSIIMIFIKGEPKKYRFVYDVRTIAGKEYVSTYEQFGWEYMGRMASVYMWRMEYKDERPEAFTDKDSIVSRNKRTVAAASVSFSIFLVAAFSMSVAIIFFSDHISANDRMQLIIGAIFFIVLAILLGTAMLYIHKGNKQQN
jgi:hypothetical protein